MSDTLGDELKLATGGKARVFAVSLKDRAAVLPAGIPEMAHIGSIQRAATGLRPPTIGPTFPTGRRPSTPTAPGNIGIASGKTATENCWVRPRREGKDGSPAGFYEVVGSTPFANDYELEFAEQLVVYEKLGTGTTTDLLIISLSANDILGHQVGPDSPQMHSMALELDRSLAEFFNFIGHQIGLANVWMALSADHGVAPLPDFAKTLRLPAANLDTKELRAQINSLLAKKYGKKADYVLDLDYPLVWLNEEAFAETAVGRLSAEHRSEADAEADTGEAMNQVGLAGYFTKWQLAHGETPATEICRRYAHSYSPEWMVRNGNPDTISGRNHERYRSCNALLVRYSCAARILWPSISAWEPTGRTPSRSILR